MFAIYIVETGQPLDFKSVALAHHLLFKSGRFYKITKHVNCARTA